MKMDIAWGTCPLECCYTMLVYTVQAEKRLIHFFICKIKEPLFPVDKKKKRIMTGSRFELCCQTSQFLSLSAFTGCHFVQILFDYWKCHFVEWLLSPLGRKIKHFQVVNGEIFAVFLLSQNPPTFDNPFLSFQYIFGYEIGPCNEISTSVYTVVFLGQKSRARYL